jgi:hypothetical protein
MTNQSWDEVLAAVEADVARTEELLAAERAERAAAADARVDYLAPAQWQLPVSGPELPPVDTMPAVPAELRERIHDLRVRIIALQVELAHELATLRAAQAGPIARAAARRAAPMSSAPARFFDSRV